MPLPLIPLAILICSAAAGTYGVKKGLISLKNSKNEKDNLGEADLLVETYADHCKKAKKEAAYKLSELNKAKLSIWKHDIPELISMCDQIKHIKTNKGHTLDQLKEKSLGPTSVEINTTLSWLNGESSNDCVVLGGLIAGPSLALSGWNLDEKGKKLNIETEKIMEEALGISSKLKRATHALNEISDAAQRVKAVIIILKEELNWTVEELISLTEKSGVDFKQYSTQEKQTIHKSLHVLQLVVEALNVSIIDEDGNLLRKNIKYLKSLSNQIVIQSKAA